MTSNFNDISHIESYLRGEMDAASRKAFEAHLAVDEELQLEVAAYRKLFDGFKGLQEDAFANEVAQWTNEAKAKSDQTPQTGRVVSINQGAKVRSLWKRVAIAASFILLIGMAAAWWKSHQYTNIYMVQNAYSPTLSTGTMGETALQATELETTFELGHQFFQNGNYTDAIRQFDQVTGTLEANPELLDKLTRKFYLENATWTKLLAQFAAGDLTDEEFSTSLDAFASDPASDYTEKAKSLQSDLNSFWRKIGR
jgi:hypothetical protein